MVLVYTPDFLGMQLTTCKLRKIAFCFVENIIRLVLISENQTTNDSAAPESQYNTSVSDQIAVFIFMVIYLALKKKHFYFVLGCG